MKLVKTISILLIFVIGVLAGLYASSAQQPENLQFADQIFAPFQSITPKESPKDRIAEQAIAVYRDRVVLDIQDAQWATFTDTHSMEPVIMKGANALELVPQSEGDIQVGDIVSYKSEYAEGNIIHRVVYKGEDEQGVYFIMKGDNLPTSDPGRVRFSQMKRVVVAIIH